MRPSSCAESNLPQHLPCEIVLLRMTTSEAPELIGLSQRTLRDLRLRVAGASGGGPDALREAGYAGAASLFDAFQTWLDDRGSKKAEDLPIDVFSARAGEFFQAAGWGRVTFRSLHDALAVIDIEGCWEAQLHGDGERAGGEMASALAAAVELRFPAALDVDHRQRIMQRSERDLPPAGGLKELRRPPRELIDREIFRSGRPAIIEPDLEGIKQGCRAGVARFAKGVRAAAARASDAQPQIAQRTLRQADQLRSF